MSHDAWDCMILDLLCPGLHARLVRAIQRGGLTLD